MKIMSNLVRTHAAFRSRIRGSRLIFSTGEQVFRWVGSQKERSPIRETDISGKRPCPTIRRQRSPVTESRGMLELHVKNEMCKNVFISYRKFVRFVSCSIDDWIAENHAKRRDEFKSEKNLEKFIVWYRSPSPKENFPREMRDEYVLQFLFRISRKLCDKNKNVLKINLSKFSKA